MKIWLTGLTGPGNTKDLKEGVEPIAPKFAGLVYAFHYPKDEGADILEKSKGEGEIIYCKWCNRFDFMRNHTLFYGPQKHGDWCVILDSNERLTQYFFDGLPALLQFCDINQIDMLIAGGKRFMYRFSEDLFWHGGTHEGLQGYLRAYDMCQIEYFQDYNLFRPTVRVLTDEDYINKHLKYYYCFPQSYHCLLNCEQNQTLFIERETRRKRFRHYCMNVLNLEDTVEAFKDYLTKRGLEDKFIKECVAYEKVLNDFYSYYFLNRRDFKKGWWDFSDLVTV